MRAIIIEYTDDGKNWKYDGVENHLACARAEAAEIPFQTRLRHAAVTPLELVTEEELEQNEKDAAAIREALGIEQ